MAVEDKVALEGEVVESLPNLLFRIQLDMDDHEVLAHLAGKMRRNRIRVLPGDRVRVEADLTEQPADVDWRPGWQTPDQIVGHAGPQHLAFRMLHDHCGTAQPAQPDRSGTLDGAGRRFPAGEHQHQRGLA